ncbi:hypothetical protein P7C73_g4406, partial [Tremellales sp. Uapishka_1]
MAKACAICGSKKWRKDAVTGSAVCEEGHVREVSGMTVCAGWEAKGIFKGYRSENLVSEPTGHALQKRRLRRAPRRNKRKEEGRNNKDYYHGDEAEWLRIQAIQQLLRLQVQALSALWSLPDVYEIIVRDLWAYQLSLHTLPSLPDSSTELLDPPPLKDMKEDDPMESDKSDSDSDSSESETSKEGDEEILEGLSDDSSGKSDVEAGIDVGRNHSDGKNVAFKRGRLRIGDTLAVLVVGLWVLRYPIMNGHQRQSGSISRFRLYYASSARNEETHESGRDKGSVPLGDLMSALEKSALKRHHGVDVPEINIAPVTWKVISSLGGTPTTYTQLTRLLSLADPNLLLHPHELVTFVQKRRSNPRHRSSSPSTPEEIEVERTNRLYDLILPELLVAATWVVLMKMVYGLDDEERAVLLDGDPALGLVKGDIWIGELRSRLKERALVGSRKALERMQVYLYSARESVLKLSPGSSLE